MKVYKNIHIKRNYKLFKELDALKQNDDNLEKLYTTFYLH